MTTKAQILTVSAAAYEAALAEQQAAAEEQQRIYDLLKVSDERCKAAAATVREATQGLMLAAKAKDGDDLGIAEDPWMVMYRRSSPPSSIDPLGQGLEDVAVLLTEFKANEVPQGTWQSIRPVRASELATRYPRMRRI